LRPRARSVIEKHRGKGDVLVIATAAADLVALPIARRLGIDRVICTRLRWKENERLESRLDGPNCYGAEKLERLRESLRATWSTEDSYKPVTAYSDHISDLGLLLWAQKGVAVNPSKPLLQAAKRHGLEIADWDR
jgi:phosphatidylglycerophosphatase C